jgi:hypothetical protein
MNRLSRSCSRILIATALGAAQAAGISLHAACAAPPAKARADSYTAKETKMNEENPFDIRLSGNGPELKAVLVNRSPVPRWALCDGELQPSRLEIVSASGKRVKAFDSRAIMKYDNTVHCRLFKSIPAGRDIEIGSARFKNSGHGFEANWGPFHFENLPAGDYKVRVVWASEFEQCFDEDTKQERKMPNVWIGRVQSNEVTLQLR